VTRISGTPQSTLPFVSGIGVITNPRSRLNKRRPELARRLAYVLGDEGRVDTPADLDSLREVAEQFLKQRIAVLAINGGDGTSHTVLSAFLGVYGDVPLPKVALLRGGTMNTVASGLGIRGRPEDLLGQLVMRYHAGEPLRSVSRDLLVVDGCRAGFLFGNGLVSNFLEAYYEGAEPSPTKAALLLARGILSVFVQGPLIQRLMRPVRCTVTVDGERWPEAEWTAVVAGTVDDIGLGFRPFHRAPEYPGHLQALGFACSAAQIVGLLPRIRLARPLRHPLVQDSLATHVVLEAEEPIAYMIDGDFHQGGQRVEIGLGPRVELVLPD